MIDIENLVISINEDIVITRDMKNENMIRLATPTGNKRLRSGDYGSLDLTVLTTKLFYSLGTTENERRNIICCLWELARVYSEESEKRDKNAYPPMFYFSTKYMSNKKNIVVDLKNSYTAILKESKKEDHNCHSRYNESNNCIEYYCRDGTIMINIRILDIYIIRAAKSSAYEEGRSLVETQWALLKKVEVGETKTIMDDLEEFDKVECKKCEELPNTMYGFVPVKTRETDKNIIIENWKEVLNKVDSPIANSILERMAMNKISVDWKEKTSNGDDLYMLEPMVGLTKEEFIETWRTALATMQRSPVKYYMSNMIDSLDFGNKETCSVC